jgi:hypothetical protein
VSKLALVIVAATSLVSVPSSAGAPDAITIDPVITGTLGTNNWYTSNVTINWIVSGAADSSGCDAKTLTTDTTGTTLTCTASDVNETVTKSRTFKIDKTPPSAAPAASRAADANGWYNHAVTVSFAGSDATSGIASCSSASYSGPDNASASVAGSCTDKAGNVGAASQPLKYDSTPPTVSRLAAAAGNRRFELKWSSSADTENVQVARSPGRGRSGTSTIYSGRARSCRDAGLSVGKAYRYTVTGFDQAGNAGSATVTVKATGPLLSPAPGARVTSPPVLTWTPVAHASYYNLQIVHEKKILSIWPRRAYFRLPRSWSFDGHRYRLEDGVYHWYVWPGFGRLSVAKYGNRLGGSTFVVGHHTRAAR